MDRIQPIKLKGTCKDYLWGGNRLRTEYHQVSGAPKIAETWLLSCHPDGPSTVVSGEESGILFPEWLKQKGNSVLGKDCEKFPYFPLLIKLIDAKERLSIQVHPDDAYARTHEGGYGKTEMWYIVDCEPGAFLYYGFDHPISKSEFQERIQNNTLEQVLNRVPVHPGDVFFIEAGTLHSIGAGILIAEIQQNSNLTYRIYDYGRRGADGKTRPLHIAKALDVTRLERPTRPTRPQGNPEQREGYRRTLLSSCDVFTVYEMEIQEAAMNADSRSFHSLLCLDGDAFLLDRGKPVFSFRKGDSVFVPAGFGGYTIKGNCRILFTAV